MSGWFYRFLTGLSRGLGLWVVTFFAWWISTGYFLFFPARVAVGLRFYRALFPQAGWFRRLALTWSQFHRFSGLFAERIRLARGGKVSQTDEGWELIQKASESGSGGILLMSHVGNWEVAAHLFRRYKVKLMLFMGERQREQVEKLQKDDLAKGGVEIVTISEGTDPSFTTVEGLRFIREGGLVSFAGDRLWNEAQRSVEVEFLGHKVKIPAGPHLFALASKAPLFIFFAFRTRGRHYHLVAYGPKEVKARDRSDRWAAVERSAQEYAHMLEDVVRRFPAHWYHFEDFLGH